MGKRLSEFELVDSELDRARRQFAAANVFSDFMTRAGELGILMQHRADLERMVEYEKQKEADERREKARHVFHYVFVGGRSWHGGYR